jgi:hypothetical protein
MVPYPAKSARNAKSQTKGRAGSHLAPPNSQKGLFMPSAPFLALITPVSGDTAPQPPLGIWGGGNQPFPTPPIAGPGRPPWWGMANDPGYSPPWARPPVDPGYSPPWARPGPGPIDPGYSPPWARPPVDPGFGNPWFDPHPSHPIYFPPGPVDPGYSPPWAQVPDLPDTVPPAQGSGGEPVPVVWKSGWTPSTGWVVVGIPTSPVPTPSKT